MRSAGLLWPDRPFLSTTRPSKMQAKMKCKTARIWTYVRDERPWNSQAPFAAWYRFSTDRKGARPLDRLGSFEVCLTEVAAVCVRSLRLACQRRMPRSPPNHRISRCLDVEMSFGRFSVIRSRTETAALFVHPLRSRSVSGRHTILRWGPGLAVSATGSKAGRPESGGCGP